MIYLDLRTFICRPQGHENEHEKHISQQIQILIKKPTCILQYHQIKEENMMLWSHVSNNTWTDAI